MVMSCSAYGCTNRYKKDSDIHFFRFPMDNLELLKKWKNAIKRKNWEPSIHSKICSAHFTQKDYQIRPGSFCPRLRETAVPSVFEGFPKYYQSTYKKRKHSKKMLDEEMMQSSNALDKEEGQDKSFRTGEKIILGEAKIYHNFPLKNIKVSDNELEEEIKTKENNDDCLAREEASEDNDADYPPVLVCIQYDTVISSEKDRKRTPINRYKNMQKKETEEQANATETTTQASVYNSKLPDETKGEQEHGNLGEYEVVVTELSNLSETIINDTLECNEGVKSEKIEYNEEEKSEKIVESIDQQFKGIEEIDKDPTQENEDDVDSFFQSIAASVKNLPSPLIHEAKIRSLQMLYDLKVLEQKLNK